MKNTNLVRHTLVATALAISSWASAETFVLDFIADGDSRFFDFDSAAFAQLNMGFNGDPDRDGFFCVSAGTSAVASCTIGEANLPGRDTPTPMVGIESDFDAFMPMVFEQVGQGPDVFINEDLFSDIGTLEYNSQTGAITDLTLDWAQHVADDDTPLNAPILGGSPGYTTRVSNIQGSVTSSESGINRIALTADIAFEYEIVDEEPAVFNGVFRIDGDRFDLFVDEVAPVVLQRLGPTTARLAWDIEGTVDGITNAPGDYNGDGEVNGLDYNTWQNTFGRVVAEGFGADGTQDGIVDAADYTVWRDNAVSISAVPFAVPEPSGAAGVLFATFASFLCRRHQCMPTRMR